MSRWLQNVGTLLEKLDDRVETVVEERVLAQQLEGEDDDDYDDEGKTGPTGGNKHKPAAATGGAIDDILAKRGLSSSVEDSQDDEDDNGDDDDDDGDEEGTDKASTDEPSSNKDDNQKKNSETETDGQVVEQAVAASSAKEDEVVPPKSLSSKDDPSQKDESVSAAGEGVVKASASASAVSTKTSSSTNNSLAPFSLQLSPPPKPLEAAAKKTTAATASSKQQSSAPSTSTTTTTTTTTPTKSAAARLNGISAASPNRSSTAASTRERELTREMKEAQKESRTLRRHVVALNDQLEAAETELQAQRQELDRAAERMEKDRQRSKEEKAQAIKRHQEEMTLLKSQHDQSLKEQQKRWEEQLEGYRTRLAQEESRRKQEGGDWTKEMTDAIEREQQMRHVVTGLEDEKAVLLSQISTLQGQQNALGSRLESLTQAADNAMERERDAEDRLDAALNQHARQISQRQTREAELERTIQELNAALVGARSHNGYGGSGGRSTSSSGSLGGEGTRDEAAGSNNSARITSLEMELETAHSHLALERERSETLQMQLRDLSKETTQEATQVHAKQIQYDRQIADMSLTISKLQARLREAENGRTSDTGANGTDSAAAAAAHDQEMANRIRLLSEEVVRLRDKVANYNSESLAMKHRLKAATDRANQAEDDLAVAKSARQSGNFDVYDAMERGGGGGGGDSGSRRRKGGVPQSGSIRAAIRLGAGQGERAEQIGQVVDAVDSFAVSTGKYMRRNPLARAGFIFYLLLIHAWTFVLLFFHAHNFEVEHGDFGAGVGVPHGPHALMQQQQQQQLPMVKPTTGANADASAAVASKPEGDNVPVAAGEVEGGLDYEKKDSNNEANAPGGGASIEADPVADVDANG